MGQLNRGDNKEWMQFRVITTNLPSTHIFIHTAQQGMVCIGGPVGAAGMVPEHLSSWKIPSLM